VDLNSPDHLQRLKMGEFRGRGADSESLQQDSRLCDTSALFRSGFSGDGLADDRVGAGHALFTSVSSTGKSRKSRVGVRGNRVCTDR
jgi:hypothetical protein